MREDHLPQASPRVFIGACIDVESERLVLRTLYDHLAKRAGWSVVLANFHCDGRQIDFVVGCDQGTLLIEAKQYRWPVHGTENGRWEMHFSAANMRSIRNAYRQALDAKNLLRDHISGRLKDAAYPNACVLAVPSLPAGSSVPSDSKVMVRSLIDLDGMLQEQSALRLREEEWVDLAADLSLESIDNLEMAFDESLSEARRMVDGYPPVKRALVAPNTASPALNPLTPSPSATTVPAMSAPGVNGRGCGSTLRPLRTHASQGPTPAAST